MAERDRLIQADRRASSLEILKKLLQYRGPRVPRNDRVKAAMLHLIFLTLYAIATVGNYNPKNASEAVEAVRYSVENIPQGVPGARPGEPGSTPISSSLATALAVSLQCRVVITR